MKKIANAFNSRKEKPIVCWYSYIMLQELLCIFFCMVYLIAYSYLALEIQSHCNLESVVNREIFIAGIAPAFFSSQGQGLGGLFTMVTSIRC